MCSWIFIVRKYYISNEKKDNWRIIILLPSKFLRPLKQLGAYRLQRRRWLRKRHFKSTFALPENLWRSFHVTQFAKFSNVFLSCILKTEIQEKEKKVVMLCFCPPQNVEVGTFTSQSCSDGKKNYQKAWCTCKVVVKPICFLTFS